MVTSYILYSAFVFPKFIGVHFKVQRISKSRDNQTVIALPRPQYVDSKLVWNGSSHKKPTIDINIFTHTLNLYF